MKTPLTLVTIITESLFKEKIRNILRDKGATGHTLINCQGEGSRGSGAPDWEGPNIKIETIRNRGERVGRNDPCPCGSGKKYKQCHGKL